MASLANSSFPISLLSIVPSSSIKLDARTLERLLMSAGADIGPSVQTLELDWMSDDDILYKILVAVLSRFTNLQVLHLHRKNGCSPSIPPSPSHFSSPPPCSPVSTPSPPAFLSARKSYHSQFSSSASLSSTFISESESTVSLSDTDCTRRSREHHYLKSWAKACSSLKTVVFLSGAEWCVLRRRKRLSTRGQKGKLGLIEEEESKMTVSILSFVRWRLQE